MEAAPAAPAAARVIQKAWRRRAARVLTLARRQGPGKQAQYNAAAAAVSRLYAACTLVERWLWTVDVVAAAADAAVRLLQAWLRVRMRMRRRCESHATIQHNEAAKVIQGAWRRQLAMRRTAKLRQARLDARRAELEADAASYIQRLGRCHLARAEVARRRVAYAHEKERHRVAMTWRLQRAGRGHAARASCALTHVAYDAAARTLQYHFPRFMVGIRERHSLRVMLEERKGRNRSIVQNEAAVVVTLFAKRMLAKLTTQRKRAARAARLAAAAAARRDAAAVQIQKVWRGGRERRSGLAAEALVTHLRATRDASEAFHMQCEVDTFAHFEARATRIQAAWRGRAARRCVAATRKPRTVLYGHPYSYSPIPSHSPCAGSPGLGYLSMTPVDAGGEAGGAAGSTFELYEKRVGLQRDPQLSRAHVMLEDAVTVLQAFMRGCWGRARVRALEHRHECACVLQTAARAAAARRGVAARRRGIVAEFAARFLQRNVRAWLARRRRAARKRAREARMEERRRRTAAVIIQRQVRRWQATAYVQRKRDLLARRTAASIKIQAFVRGCYARATEYRPRWEVREQERLLVAQRFAGAVISRWASARLVRMKFVARQAARGAAATHIQRTWRGMVARRRADRVRAARARQVRAAQEEQAAIVLQSWWRMILGARAAHRRRHAEAIRKEEEERRRAAEEAARAAAEELARRQKAAVRHLTRIARNLRCRVGLGAVYHRRLWAVQTVQRFGRAEIGREVMIWELHRRRRAEAAASLQSAWRQRREELFEKYEIRELQKRMAALARTEHARLEAQARREIAHARADTFDALLGEYFRCKPDEVVLRRRAEYAAFVRANVERDPHKTEMAAIAVQGCFKRCAARNRIEALRTRKRAERRHILEADRISRAGDGSFVALALPPPSPAAMPPAVLPPLNVSVGGGSGMGSLGSLEGGYDRVHPMMGSGRRDGDDGVVNIDWLQARTKPSPDQLLQQRRVRELRWRASCLEKEEDSLRHELLLLARTFHHQAAAAADQLRRGEPPSLPSWDAAVDSPAAVDSTLLTSQDNTLFTVSAAQEPDIRTPNRAELGGTGDMLVSSVSRSPSTEPGMVRCVPTGVFESVYGRPLPPRAVQIPPIQPAGAAAAGLQPLRYTPLRPEDGRAAGRWRAEASAHAQVANIARQVGVNDSLVEDVDLSGSGAKDADVAHVLHALRYNTHVKVLNLARNDLHDSVAQELAALMLSNRTIQSVDLSHTYVSDLGATHLAAAVFSNPSLTHLSVENTLVTKGTKQSLGDRLRKNKHAQITPGRMRPKHVKATPRRGHLATLPDHCTPSPAPLGSTYALGITAPSLN